MADDVMCAGHAGSRARRDNMPRVKDACMNEVIPAECGDNNLPHAYCKGECTSCSSEQGHKTPSPPHLLHFLRFKIQVTPLQRNTG